MGVVLPLANILTSIPAVMAGAGPVTPLDPSARGRPRAGAASRDSPAAFAIPATAAMC